MLCKVKIDVFISVKNGDTLINKTLESRILGIRAYRTHFKCQLTQNNYFKQPPNTLANHIIQNQTIPHILVIHIKQNPSMHEHLLNELNPINTKY